MVHRPVPRNGSTLHGHWPKRREPDTLLPLYGGYAQDVKIALWDTWYRKPKKAHGR